MNDNKLIVAISSRALFDLDDSNAIYERDGVEAYRDYQISHEDEPLATGEAFHLVQKLLRINRNFSVPRVEVILLSRNSSDTGLRIFNSIQHYQLAISRAAFCSGASPYRYVVPFGCKLFLSMDSDDVRQALSHGIAAATIVPRSGGADAGGDELRFAFDGDAVLFSDEAERVYQAGGLAEFERNEVAAARRPLEQGPFKEFLQSLQGLQSELNDTEISIRTALVTARAAPSHERVIRTLRHWGIRLDECLFLGGLDKGKFLAAYGADIFFDDQQGHCDDASRHVAAGHVPTGTRNA